MEVPRKKAAYKDRLGAGPNRSLTLQQGCVAGGRGAAVGRRGGGRAVARLACLVGGARAAPAWHLMQSVDPYAHSCCAGGAQLLLLHGLLLHGTCAPPGPTSQLLQASPTCTAAALRGPWP